MTTNGLPISTQAILAARPPKNAVDPRRPYAFFLEQEPAAGGAVVDVATLFLTNRECPWRCLMCDLWKNTTDDTVPLGALVEQLDYALARLPPARHVKLYNSGNFFDPRAVPPDDYRAIAGRIARFERAIVENHPKLCGEACLRFRDLCERQMEIALGLETIHPDVLPRLNKGMTLDDFARAVEFLLAGGISVRAFVLLRPPLLSEEEGVAWAIKSVEHAFALGVECCAVIPTRGGDGVLAQLAERGLFAEPSIRSLERVLDHGIALRQGRVLADLWDIERFYDCRECGSRRAARLAEMNLRQTISLAVACEHCTAR